MCHHAKLINILKNDSYVSVIITFILVSYINAHVDSGLPTHPGRS
jgi:hypothetical protein